MYKNRTSVRMKAVIPKTGGIMCETPRIAGAVTVLVLMGEVLIIGATF